MLSQGHQRQPPSTPKPAGACSGDGVVPRRENMAWDSHLFPSAPFSSVALAQASCRALSWKPCAAMSRCQTDPRREARLEFRGSTGVHLCVAPPGWWLALVPSQGAFFSHPHPCSPHPVPSSEWLRGLGVRWNRGTNELSPQLPPSASLFPYWGSLHF